MIFFFCPDLPYPTGGVKQIHRQAEILQAAGHQVAILYTGSKRPRIWFPTQVPCWLAPPWLQDRTSWRALLRSWLCRLRRRRQPQALTPRLAQLPVSPTEQDLLVVPEIYAARIGEFPAALPKLIFNQGCFLTFFGFDSTFHASSTSLLELCRAADVIGLLTNSPYGMAYLRWTFPGLPVGFLDLEVKVPSSVPALDQREALLVFNPRKSPEVAHQVFGILGNRGVLRGWRVQALADLTETDVEQVFRQARLYIATSLQEGLGLPPLEAMANGCAVVGFPAWGGDAYFTEAYSRPVSTGDVLALAVAVEESLNELFTDPSVWQEKVDRARSMVQQMHGADRAIASTLAAFGPFLNNKPAP